MQAATAAQLVPPSPPLFDETRLAVSGFLVRYSGITRIGYATDLRAWFGWCAEAKLEIFGVRRAHIEMFARWMEEERHLARATIGRRLSTVVGFYRFAVVDGYMAESPAEHVRRPKIDTESTTLGLDRMELGAFLAQATAAGPVDHALAGLLGLLGLRVTEACSINIEHLSTERGHRTVKIMGKGGKAAVIPFASPRWPGDRPGCRRADERAGAAVAFRTAPRPPRCHPHRAASRPQGGIPRGFRPTRCATASSPPPSTPAFPSVTSRSLLVMPIPVRQRATTGPATTWTGMPATSFPHS